MGGPVRTKELAKAVAAAAWSGQTKCNKCGGTGRTAPVKLGCAQCKFSKNGYCSLNLVKKDEKYTYKNFDKEELHWVGDVFDKDGELVPADYETAYTGPRGLELSLHAAAAT